MSYIGNTSTTQAFTPAVDYFSGNASTTAFTLSKTIASVAQVQVTVANVPQNPSSAYTISGQTITFTSAPPSGTNNIYVYYTSPITQTFAPAQGTVTTNSLTSGLTITTPTINQITSAASTALTLQSAGTTAVTIDTSQNVGIGTSSPSLTGATKALTINALASGNYSAIELASAGAATANFIANSSNVYIGSYTNIPFVFQTNNTERMRINSGGALLINATSQVSTTTYFSVQGVTNSANLSEWKDTGTTYASNNYYQIFYNSSNGTAGGVAHNAASTVAFNTSSDVRLKENIVDAPSVLDKVLNVKVRSYNWKEDKHQVQYGFIAQELYQQLPEAVGKGDDSQELTDPKGTWQVEYGRLTPMLVKAIQELKAINDTQAETINALTARIEALENR